MKKQPKALIIVSDLHIGSQLGLCPPKGFRFDNNGHYKPNRIQRILWEYWSEFWCVWVKQVTRGKPYAVVLNGDLTDGCHHDTTEVWSGNSTIQRNAALEVLQPIAEKATQIYVVRGTPAHTGEAGRSEEELAKNLGAVPTKEGQFARPELWIEMGSTLSHFMHHIGTTSSSAHESSAVNAEMIAEFTEAARWGTRPPDYCGRSHRHRYIEVGIEGKRGMAKSFVTPGWQAKGGYAYKIAGARTAPPQFGGVGIFLGDEEHYMRSKVWSVSQTEKVVL